MKASPAFGRRRLHTNTDNIVFATRFLDESGHGMKVVLDESGIWMKVVLDEIFTFRMKVVLDELVFYRT